MVVRGRQLLEGFPVADQLVHDADHVSAGLAHPHEIDGGFVGHRWGRPQPYGGSFIARCSCGHVSPFFLNVGALLTSICEAHQLELLAGERAALVGWELHRG